MEPAHPRSAIASCRLLRHPRLAFAAGLPPLHSPKYPNPTQPNQRAGPGRARFILRIALVLLPGVRVASSCRDPRASGRVWIGGAVFPGGVGVKRDAPPAPLPGGFGCLPAGQSHGPRSRAPVAITTQGSSSSQRRCVPFRSVPFQHPVVTAPIHR